MTRVYRITHKPDSHLKTMATSPITEGTVVFKHPSLPEGKEVKTWYKIHGSLSSGRRPLVLLHGGPGCPHMYLTIPFEDYAAKTGTPVVFYDQIGSGKSTRLPETRLDEEFWTTELFIAELDNLLDHLGIRNDFDLYGHSWGAMLLGKYAVSASGKSSGLHKAVLASGPCNSKNWMAAGRSLVDRMPKDVQDTYWKYSNEKNYDAPEYREAVMAIYQKHMCRLTPWPQILVEAFDQLEEEDTSYMTMCGPDEMNMTGSLRGKLNFEARSEICSSELCEITDNFNRL